MTVESDATPLPINLSQLGGSGGDRDGHDAACFPDVAESEAFDSTAA